MLVKLKTKNLQFENWNKNKIVVTTLEVMAHPKMGLQNRSFEQLDFDSSLEET